MSNNHALKIFFTVIVLSVSIATSEANAQPGSTGNVQLVFGAKALDSYWEPADEQSEFGIQADFHNGSWPVGIAIGYYRGSGESDPAGILETETTELQVGIKKVWDVTDIVHFSAGGGLTVASLEASIPSVVSEKDDGIGVWLSGAVYWTLGEDFDLGLQIMSSAAEGTFIFGTQTAEIGGGHFGFTVGTHW